MVHCGAMDPALPTELPPPGWYPDPADRIGLRWWDGHSWSGHVSYPVPFPSGPSELISLGGHAFVLAGWWRRAGGWLFDVLVIGVFTFVTEMLISEVAYAKLGAFGFPGDHPTASPAIRVLVNMFGLALGIAYAVWFIGSQGRTVGMMIFGTRAVEQSNGAELTMPQAWRRALAVVMLTQSWSEAAFFSGLGQTTTTHVGVSGGLFELVGLAGALLTYLWPLGNPLNQTLQDKFARSVVVINRKAP